MYFKREQDLTNGQLHDDLHPLGRVFLSDIVTIVTDGIEKKRAFVFALHTKKRAVLLQAASTEDRQGWVEAIRRALESEGEAERKDPFRKTLRRLKPGVCVCVCVCVCVGMECVVTVLLLCPHCHCVVNRAQEDHLGEGPRQRYRLYHQERCRTHPGQPCCRGRSHCHHWCAQTRCVCVCVCVSWPFLGSETSVCVQTNLKVHCQLSSSHSLSMCRVLIWAL